MPELLLAPADSIADCRLEIDARVQPAKLRRGLIIWRIFVWLNVAALLLCATTLRCEGLGNLPGINGDEAWYGVQAEALLHGQQIPWRTPSGNLLNPFFFVPTVLLHAVFTPSFVVLRTTAVLSGLLALVVNYWLCWRVFGRKMAVISTTVLAVLPIDIAYSRIAWDASQSLLATLPCIYLPLLAIQDNRRRRRFTVATGAALLIAIVVHPTNVFVAPVALTCLAYSWWQQLGIAARRIKHRCGQSIGRKAILCLLVALAIATAVGANIRAGRRTGGPALERTVALREKYCEFITNLGRLFSGATVCQYFSGAIQPGSSVALKTLGSRSDFFLYDAGAWLVAGWLLMGLGRGAWPLRPEWLCIAFGWAGSLFGFWLVAGPGGVAPNFERYAIWTIAPAAILVSSAIDGWLARGERVSKLSTVLALAIAWAMLFGYQVNCLDFIRQTGGQSHRTFRTAAIEPKEAALAFIRGNSAAGRNVRIVTSEWWLYWPMRYLAFGDAHRSLRVEMTPSASDAERMQKLDSCRREQLWLVEFTDSPACNAIRHSAYQSLHEATITDFAGRPLISLFAVQPPAAANAKSPGLQSQTGSIVGHLFRTPKSGSLEKN